MCCLWNNLFILSSKMQTKINKKGRDEAPEMKEKTES